MDCLECETETRNPKFCSRSCAAKYNNKKFPKRSSEGICKKCERQMSKGRTYCKDCHLIELEKRSIEKWESCTLEEMKGVGNANAGGRYPYMRELARKKYLKSNKPQYCVVCNYDKHFDVCHIRDIKLFPLEATVAQVNHIDNLVALCKNHHWEYDNGMFYDITLGLVPVIGKSKKGVYNVEDFKDVHM